MEITWLSHSIQVDTYRDSCHILDDLEARASDLLQANGIVWVEGPSDRIYFKNRILNPER